MAIDDIPVFRPARRGQVVRSADWNAMQRELRNSIRTHRHSRVAGDEVDDSSAEDNGLQIESAEIADEAITFDKLDPAVREAISQDGEIGEDIQRLVEGSAQVQTGVVELAPRAREQIEHGLGNVPVAVVLGVFQRELIEQLQLDGEFELYNGFFRQSNIIAAVPREPDGTFLLIAQTESEAIVRWWAYARSADL
jgi:hypothetical protein